uniref:(northern house mosquito) hypothetical protein n=1 Tax=Culex pipiens TaxID=7175 RepID=A0A8D8DRA4_CULPI
MRSGRSKRYPSELQTLRLRHRLLRRRRWTKPPVLLVRPAVEAVEGQTRSAGAMTGPSGRLAGARPNAANGRPARGPTPSPSGSSRTMSGSPPLWPTSGGPSRCPTIHR